MKIILIIILTVLFSFPVHAYEFAQNWSRTDTALQGVFLASLAADYKQTRYISDNPDQHKETCFMMNEHPSHSSIDKYFLSYAVIHTAVSLILPDKYKLWGFEFSPRNIWQSVFIGVELQSNVNNINCGVKIEF